MFECDHIQKLKTVFAVKPAETKRIVKEDDEDAEVDYWDYGPALVKALLSGEAPIVGTYQAMTSTIDKFSPHIYQLPPFYHKASTERIDTLAFEIINGLVASDRITFKRALDLPDELLQVVRAFSRDVIRRDYSYDSQEVADVLGEALGLNRSLCVLKDGEYWVGRGNLLDALLFDPLNPFLIDSLQTNEERSFASGGGTSE